MSVESIKLDGGGARPVAVPPLDRPASLASQRAAWLTVAALFIAYIFSFIDRMIIGLLVEPIKADLDLTDTEISLLQGIAFALFFTIAGLPIGRLIDRAHRMRTVAAGITVWSVMTAASSVASSFGQFFVARMGVGIGEAVLSPAAYSIISDSFERRRLGLAMGVYGLGSAIGAGLAFMIGASVVAAVTTTDVVAVPLLGELRPWRLAFLVAGLPGLVVAFVFLFLPEPPRGAHHRATAVPVRDVARHLSVHRAFFWSVFIGVSAVNLSVLGTVSWLPAMMMRSFGVDISFAGYLAGGLLIAGGLIGMIGGGALMDRLGGTPESRMRFCAWASVVGIACGAIFPLAPSLLGLSLAFVAFFSAAAATVGAAPSSIQQLSPGAMRGTISAVYVFVINIVGLGFGPTVTAVLGDQLFPFEDGIRYAMAIVAPVGYAIAALLFFVAARHARVAWAEMEAAR